MHEAIICRVTVRLFAGEDKCFGPGVAMLLGHIRETGSMEALDHVLRRGYHLALLRYAEEDEDYYHRYCDRHGLHREPVMEFEYRLLTNREGPLAKCEVTDITQLNSYMEVLHGDFQLPGGEDSGLRWHTNPNRRIHVYERCSQFSILQNLPNAYMWASPMPRRALEQYHLVLRKCPAQCQRMKDVLVYPDRGALRPEEKDAPPAPSQPPPPAKKDRSGDRVWYSLQGGVLFCPEEKLIALPARLRDKTSVFSHIRVINGREYLVFRR